MLRVCKRNSRQKHSIEHDHNKVFRGRSDTTGVTGCWGESGRGDGKKWAEHRVPYSMLVVNLNMSALRLIISKIEARYNISKIEARYQTNRLVQV